MFIHVKSLNGNKNQINVDEDATVKQVKLILQEKEGIPAEQLRIIFKGKLLTDTDKLKDKANRGQGSGSGSAPQPLSTGDKVVNEKAAKEVSAVDAIETTVANTGLHAIQISSATGEIQDDEPLPTCKTGLAPLMESKPVQKDSQVEPLSEEAKGEIENLLPSSRRLLLKSNVVYTNFRIYCPV